MAFEIKFHDHQGITKKTRKDFPQKFLAVRYFRGVGRCSELRVLYHI